jgi:phosphopantothenoylcysteine decarboxylase/phosphopantothenate--cysteine ligase
MGLALAEEARRRGAEVTVVAANVSLPRPEGIRFIDVETASELESAAREGFGRADVLLMAAAVADFRPRNPEQSKIKKAGRDSLALELEATEDVLGALAASRRGDQTLVGFAAEHGGDPVAEAREKLERKGLDAVVVNDISRADIGFDTEENEVTIVTSSGARPVPHGPKSAVAAAVLDEVELLRTQSSARATLGEST